LKRNDTLGIYLPPKHILWCIERQATFYGLLCRRSQRTNKFKKYATSPLPTPYTPKAAYINIAKHNQPCQISTRSV